MLIISRRSGETLVIGDDIKITVLSTKGNQIRLGIDAPKETKVYREEILERLKKFDEMETEKLG